MSTFVTNTLYPAILPWNYFSGTRVAPAITPESSAFAAYSQAPLNTSIPFNDRYTELNPTVVGTSQASIVLSNLTTNATAAQANSIVTSAPVTTTLFFAQTHNISTNSIPASFYILVSEAPYTYTERTITDSTVYITTTSGVTNKSTATLEAQPANSDSTTLLYKVTLASPPTGAAQIQLVIRGKFTSGYHLAFSGSRLVVS